MSEALRKLFHKTLASGLSRQTLTKCSTWAERYRMMGQPFPGKWSFRNSPWLREMHDCEDEIVVGQKCAQMGYTETALDRALHAIDVHGRSVLYLMPTDFVASDFSTSRFDPVLSGSKHLENLFSDVKNIQQKRAGMATLYIRGSNSKSKLKSISTPIILFDELDEMCEENVRLAEERSSGQPHRFWMYISTPTVPGTGIAAKFDLSTQDHFFFRCPHCKQYIELSFPDNLVITGDDPSSPLIKSSHLVCHLCKGILPHEGKRDFLANGKWVHTFDDRISRGFYINQLYSIALEPWMIARDYLLSLTNPTYEQEFHNSKLGLAHVVKGAQIDDEHINACIGSHSTRTSRYNSGSRVCMGVDVGNRLNYEITEYIRDPKTAVTDLSSCMVARTLRANVCNDFEELDKLMVQYSVDCCVIDNQPETRKALEFANRYPGRVFLCIYNNEVAGKTIQPSTKEHKVVVNRTVWLDTALGRIKTGRISLPMDIPQEYRRQIKAPIRVYKTDRHGNSIGVYVHEESKPDHYAHSRCYCEIALNCCEVQANSNIIIGVRS